MKHLLIIWILFLIVQQAYPQRQLTPDVIERFRRTHPRANVDEMLKIIDRENRKWEKKHKEAMQKAKKLGLPIEMSTPDGRKIELQYFEKGMPVYYISFNLNAARTISTNVVWETYPNLTDSLIHIGQRDGGKMYIKH